jgi:hypothetical protein
LFRPTKSVFSIFVVPTSGFICEAAIKTANGKLGTIAHINNRPHGIDISAVVLSRKPLKLFSRFYASSRRFRWNRDGFAL